MFNIIDGYVHSIQRSTYLHVPRIVQYKYICYRIITEGRTLFSDEMHLLVLHKFTDQGLPIHQPATQILSLTYLVN